MNEQDLPLEDQLDLARLREAVSNQEHLLVTIEKEALQHRVALERCGVRRTGATAARLEAQHRFDEALQQKLDRAAAAAEAK